MMSLSSLKTAWAARPDSTALARSIDMIGTPIFVLDVHCIAPLDVRFAGINRLQAEAFGIAPGVALGLGPGEVHPHRSATNVQANCTRCIAERCPVQFEEAFMGPEGERWFEITLAPWSDDGGDVRMIVGSSHEITARKSDAAEAAGQIAQLERLSEDLRIYASMAAHDVRSPLASIESLISLVQKDFVDQGDGKLLLLEACLRTARQARDQMEDLLRHADSLSTDAATPEPVALDALIREVSAFVDPEGRIAITWPDTLLMTEGVTLQLVLRNLMGNAARHCTGRISVEIEPFHDDPGTDAVHRL